MAIVPFMDTKILAALEIVQLDRVRGLAQLKVLAESGNATAVLYVALHLGEDPNCRLEEIEWLQRADQLGFADAAWNLAMISHEQHDKPTATKWIDRAAELGNEEALTVKHWQYDVERYLYSLRQ